MNLAVCTDGANFSDNQNMYEAMRMAYCVSHVRDPDSQQWLTPREILRSATEGSARMLGFEQLGRIEPGYLANIVFLDLNAINWIALNDPVNQLVHTEDGSSVDSVMIAGRMVVQNRRLAGIDLSRIAAQADAARRRLNAKNAPNKALYDRLEGVVGTFCPALAQKPYHVHRYGACPH